MPEILVVSTNTFDNNNSVVQDPAPQIQGKGRNNEVGKNKTTFARRLGLLLWKNVLLRRRHFIVTILEILLPTLIALAIAGFRTQIVDDNKTVMNETTIFPSQNEAVCKYLF